MFCHLKREIIVMAKQFRLLQVFSNVHETKPGSHFRHEDRKHQFL